MPKFMVINDPHNSDRPPIGRTETYTDDIFTKQEECWTIAKRTKCDFVVLAGDIFHRFRGPQIADSLKVRLIDLYQRAPCPVYAVAGNHDLSSKGVASIWDRPFGVVAKPRAFMWLSEATVVESHAPDEDVLLIPRNWEPHIDTLPSIFKLTKAEAALVVPSDMAPGQYRYAVMVAHASILPPGRDAIYPHHNADKLPTDLLDVLVCGHIHEDLGIHKLASGCWFCNIGALSRPDRAKHNLERTPEVLVVTMEKGEIEFERHPLTTTRPAEEVFFEKGAVTERDIGDFASALDATLELEETPLDELVAKYTKGQPDAVVERLRGYLTEVEE